MSSPLQLSDELISQLEGVAIRTSQGSFVKMEDIRRLAGEKKDASAISEALPKPKTLVQAREAAKKLLAETFGEQGPRDPGRALPATEPQSPSRA